MPPIRIFYVLLVACATLLMSFRPPAPPVARQAVIMEEVVSFDYENQAEEAAGEKNTKTNQQGPLEEIHDLHCVTNQDHQVDWRFGASWTLGNLHIQPLGISLMTCFQPPELRA